MNGLVDTSIVIDVLRLYAPAGQWIAQFQPNQVPGVSKFVWMEVIEGIQSKRAQTLAYRTLNDFNQIDSMTADIDWALTQLTRYQSAYQIGAFDCLIASASHRLQLPLYTRNLKHMGPLLGPLAVRPYS